MTSNFDFLHPHYPTLHEQATHAEILVYAAPRASCFYTRFTLEQAVHWLYANDAYLQPPYDTNLGALIHEQTFKDNLNPPSLFQKVRTIHKIGNLAVHDSGTISDRDALHALQELFHFLYWLYRYYAPDGKTIASLTFNSRLIPEDTASPDLSRQQLQELQTQLSQTDEMRRIAETRQQQTQQELDTLKAQIAALKQQNQAIPDTHNYNEADTRRYLIDVLLKEAGWNIHQPGWTEVEVQGMPTDSGKGRVDYVLWGDNGKPLALVEAKRTTLDPRKGQHQAELYANCLETQFNQRPLIFCTNGYQTWIWDDINYPPRLIQGFLKKDELERLIFRRTSRKRLHLVQVNADIVNRSYQTEAIRRITETFTKKGRKSLLVMATGTGKTRTAIALIDLLIRANWVKRTLFLADRNALLTQAYRAIKTHLPTVTPIDLTKDKDADTANVVLSTYPTMYNCINRSGEAQRFFGSGHFDLVIIDEAHRSVYKKYRALFEYFDALLVGLTATPRTEVHRDTYEIFDLEPGVPSFAYELNDAIADNYLVPPKGIEIPFKFLRQGVNYEDLSPEEQEEYEEKFTDESGDILTSVDAAALNNWLFNTDTVDKALKLLMERGLKVEGGDRLGKTIIFARNHNHANFIAERFDKNYPQHKGKFAQVIDSHNPYAHSLLDDFSEPDKQPTIAVSVDMLDTGVDIPEVVNLVFFKPIYSRVKFNQMIGRGTRLCPDLFGIGHHKQEFLVFDLCGNFDFFQQDIPEANAKPSQSLTTRLVKTRLELSQLLTQDAELQTTLLNDLHQHVATMKPENFLVRPHLQQVEEFSHRERWNHLTRDDIHRIATEIAPLPNGLPRESRLAKEFDLLCLKLQLSILKSTPDFVKLRDQLRDILSRLEAKRDIPMVKNQLPLIEEVQAEDWWTDVTPWMVDYLRIHLRDLIQFIDRQDQAIVYTNFTDELLDITAVDVPIHQTGFSPYQYRKKVEAYIRNHQDHIAIAKLKRNLPLTDADLTAFEDMLFNATEIENRDRFFQVFGQNISLKLFIRKLVGIDRSAAKQAFSHYLQGTRFSANQIHFIETIIDYLSQNGVIDPGLLYEPPFTDTHPEGLDGVFGDDDADQIISLIRSFNETVGENFGAA